MRIVKKFKDVYKTNNIVYHLFYPAVRLYYFLFFYIIPDKWAIEHRFKKKMGYKLDWDNLRTFSEKLQWLKLYDRKPWYTDCVDKLKVGDFVAEKLGTDKYLIPLCFETDNWREIKPENFPDEPFVIKCNHDSGSKNIILDKSSINWTELRRYYKRRLRDCNFFWMSREWPYKNVQPRIMVEKFLSPKASDEGLLEYKFYCFSGEIKFIQLSILKNGKKSFIYLDSEYNSYGMEYHIGEMDMIKQLPDIYCKDEMRNIAQVLAKEFEYHIRVDIYQVDRKLYVGELTFFDSAGFEKIYPESWNLELGRCLRLPIDKN